MELVFVRADRERGHSQRGKLDLREEVVGSLVVACGHSAHVVELVEEALDEIAVAIEAYLAV